MRLILSSHAIARYQERVRPTLELDQAETELRALVANAGEPSPTLPEGYDTTEPNDAALELSDGVCLVFRQKKGGGSTLIATTVVVRGAGYSTRKRREEKRKRRRARARMRHSSSSVNRGKIANPEGYGGYGWAD